jgi:DNA recombination protein RmuC
MDALLVAAAAALLVGLVGWLVVSARRGRSDDDKLAVEMARLVDSLEARLKHIAETQTIQQQAVAERLHAQERFLDKAMETRLSDISKKVVDGLATSQTRTLETMGRLEARLAVIDRAQTNISELGAQMVGLQDILSNKQARGAFGEIALNDLVRDALPPSAYEFQKTLSNGRRADCLLVLPDPPGPIAIDAKFPFESYRALREAKDDAAHGLAARAFRAALSVHIKDIESKYIIPGETAPSALMFLPSEAVYAELHANFPDIVEASHRAKVWITSPTTLMATLLTVRAILKDARMHEQAALIQKEVMVLLKDVERLSGRVDSLRSHFGQADKDIDQIEISAKKVLARGRKIEDVEIEQGDGDETEAGPRLVSGSD